MVPIKQLPRATTLVLLIGRNKKKWYDLLQHDVPNRFHEIPSTVLTVKWQWW
jgi:hypothetical protein